MLILGQGHRDALPLVLQPRAQASFPPTAGRALTVVASSSHRRQPLVTMQLLFASGQRQPVWAKCRLVVVVVGGWGREVGNDVSVHIESRKTAAQHGSPRRPATVGHQGLKKSRQGGHSTSNWTECEKCRWKRHKTVRRSHRQKPPRHRQKTGPCRCTATDNDAHMHRMVGAVSLWTGPPALYLCTGP